MLRALYWRGRRGVSNPALVSLPRDLPAIASTLSGVSIAGRQAPPRCAGTHDNGLYGESLMPKVRGQR